VFSIFFVFFSSPHLDGCFEVGNRVDPSHLEVVGPLPDKLDSLLVVEPNLFLGEGRVHLAVKLGVVENPKSEPRPLVDKFKVSNALFVPRDKRRRSVTLKRKPPLLDGAVLESTKCTAGSGSGHV